MALGIQFNPVKKRSPQRLHGISRNHAVAFVALSLLLSLPLFHAIPDLCFLPLETGDGGFPVVRFYYNQYTYTCASFLFWGGGGNANSFATLVECENTCGTAAESDATSATTMVTTATTPVTELATTEVISSMAPSCLLPQENHLCHTLQFLQRFYYDQTTGECTSFTFFDCGGNANNFLTLEDCMAHCIVDVTTEPATPDTTIEAPSPTPAYFIAPTSLPPATESHMTVSIATFSTTRPLPVYTRLPMQTNTPTQQQPSFPNDPTTTEATASSEPSVSTPSFDATDPPTTTSESESTSELPTESESTSESDSGTGTETLSQSDSQSGGLTAFDYASIAVGCVAFVLIAIFVAIVAWIVYKYREVQSANRRVQSSRAVFKSGSIKSASYFQQPRYSHREPRYYVHYV